MCLLSFSCSIPLLFSREEGHDVIIFAKVNDWMPLVAYVEHALQFIPVYLIYYQYGGTCMCISVLTKVIIEGEALFCNREDIRTNVRHTTCCGIVTSFALSPPMIHIKIVYYTPFINFERTESFWDFNKIQLYIHLQLNHPFFSTIHTIYTYSLYRF